MHSNRSVLHFGIRFSRILLTLVFASSVYCINGQRTYWDAQVSSVPCIRRSLNRIENDSVGFVRFCDRLRLLKQGSIRSINVVHIGDSHIQADDLSGTVRELLQSDFGNAGRGLVFPYAVARTNSQRGIKSASVGMWESKRCVVLENPLPTGISGFTLKAMAADAAISISIADAPGLDYRFNKASFFMKEGKEQYTPFLTDSSGILIGRFLQNDPASVPFLTSFVFNDPVSEFILRFKAADTLQNNAILYGVVLEKDTPGVLYNTIGVNGAEYRHFTAASDFIDQLPALRPDLIIVSLGTNEAFSADFDSTAFLNDIDRMILVIRKTCPRSEILISTPPDSYKGIGRKRTRNRNMRVARNTLVGYCKRNGIAYWDLYDIMGGFGSMATWASKGLVNRDYLHFRKKGYELQGYLLYAAIIDCYGK